MIYISLNEYILKLTAEALVSMEKDNSSLSSLIRQAIRIARLRNDFDNLWWLEWEMCAVINKEEGQRVLIEVAPHYSADQYKQLWKHYTLEWANERKTITFDSSLKIEGNDKILAKGVPEIESDVAFYGRIAESERAPSGLHPVDLYFVEKEKSETKMVTGVIAKSAQEILERIKQRVHNFLSKTETELLYGQFNADIFEANRRYVEVRLGELSPDALNKANAAFKRLQEGDPEARAHALTSCRRLLKSIADTLYPPKEKSIIGFDGKERVLTDDKYIARLWQYIYEKTPKNTAQELLQAQIQDLGNRIDKIHKLSNKGVHAEINESEVNQCVIQTYLAIGDILRIAESNSAIGIEPVFTENNGFKA